MWLGAARSFCPQSLTGAAGPDDLAYDRLGFGTDPEAGGDPLFLRTASAMGDAIVLLGAPVLLAVVVAVVCRATSGVRLIPRWAVGSRYVVAALLLVGWTWFPMMLFFLWALATGIALAVPRRGAAPWNLARAASGP